MLEGEPAGYQAVLVDLYAKRELACQLLGVPLRTDDFDAWMAYCELCKSVGDGITLRQAGEGLVAKRILGEYADAVTRMLSMLASAGITRPETAGRFALWGKIAIRRLPVGQRGEGEYAEGETTEREDERVSVHEDG